MRITINQYKDPYQTTSIMESKKVFFVAQVLEDRLEASSTVSQKEAMFETMIMYMQICASNHLQQCICMYIASEKCANTLPFFVHESWFTNWYLNSVAFWRWWLHSTSHLCLTKRGDFRQNELWQRTFFVHLVLRVSACNPFLKQTCFHRLRKDGLIVLQVLSAKQTPRNTNIASTEIPTILTKWPTHSDSVGHNAKVTKKTETEEKSQGSWVDKVLFVKIPFGLFLTQSKSIMSRTMAFV